jgi:hypothetical protein
MHFGDSVPRWSVAGRQQAYAAGATRVDAASATKGPRTRNVMPDYLYERKTVDIVPLIGDIWSI